MKKDMTEVAMRRWQEEYKDEIAYYQQKNEQAATF